MDKRKIIITISIFLFLIILCITVFVFSLFKSGNGNVSEVFIPKGSSPHAIAKILKKNNVISSDKLFIAAVKVLNCSKELKAGLYDFSAGEGVFKVINKIRAGENKSIKVTIPEGFDIRKTAAVLNDKNICDGKEFIKLAEDKKLEGFLFPDTYFFFPQSAPDDIIKAMTDEFKSFWNNNCEEQAKFINLSQKDIITLASIVEKEAVAASERPVIAGVFMNRLKKGIKLESCATVLYAMGINKERLTFEDLKFESPYNTYKYKGLPPGPICNPGAEAVKAVLNPAVTDSLYFVSKGDGTHYFSATFEQHVKNKKESKKKAKK